MLEVGFMTIPQLFRWQILFELFKLSQFVLSVSTTKCLNPISNKIYRDLILYSTIKSSGKLMELRV